MNKLAEKKCLTCKDPFTQKSESNEYCSRKCFKKAYYHKKKAEELASNKCPNFTCPQCGQQIVLEFDPVKENMRWLHYQCAGCNTLMIHVSEQIYTVDESIS